MDQSLFQVKPKFCYVRLSLFVVKLCFCVETLNTVKDANQVKQNLIILSMTRKNQMVVVVVDGHPKPTHLS